MFIFKHTVSEFLSNNKAKLAFSMPANVQFCFTENLLAFGYRSTTPALKFTINQLPSNQ